MSPAFTVLHTADWHLGVKLRDQDRSGEHRMFMDWLLGVMEQERVDLLVIAGDIFDSANPPQSALLQWYNFLSQVHARLPHARILAVAGNHDSPQVMEAAARPLEVLRVTIVGEMQQLSDVIKVYTTADGRPALAVAMIPFLRDRELRLGGEADTASALESQLRAGIARHYREAAAAAQPWLEQGLPVIATGHLTARGGRLSASEREVHVGNLGAVSTDAFPSAFCAVLLGHLHRPQAVGECAHIRYSGSPLALSFSESEDVKEVRILRFADGRLAEQRAVAVPVYRPLIRVEAAGSALESTLKHLSVPPSAFTPWVELTVHGSADTPALLLERVATALPAGAAEVLSLRRETNAAPEPGLAAAPASLQQLTPHDVFEHTLAAASIPEDGAVALRLTFARLMDIFHAESGPA